MESAKQSSNFFPVFGPLHEDEPQPDAPAETPSKEPPHVVAFAKDKSKVKSTKRRRRHGNSTDRDLEVLQAVMNPDYIADDPDEAAFDLERALRSVVFLLDYASGRGNKRLEATASQGLSQILRECADDVRLVRPVRR